MVTYEAIDNVLEIFDDANEVLMLSQSWMPKKSELEAHNVEENFEKYYAFLLYLSESIREFKDVDGSFPGLTREELLETEKYLRDIFLNNTVMEEDEI